MTDKPHKRHKMRLAIAAAYVAVKITLVFGI